MLLTSWGRFSRSLRKKKTMATKFQFEIPKPSEKYQHLPKLVRLTLVYGGGDTITHEWIVGPDVWKTAVTVEDDVDPQNPEDPLAGTWWFAQAAFVNDHGKRQKLVNVKVTQLTGAETDEAHDAAHDDTLGVDGLAHMEHGCTDPGCSHEH